MIVGPDGFAWITDGGLNAIVSVDPATEAVRVYPLPDGAANANLNTATFDGADMLWFTGQNGIYGRLDPAVGVVEVFAAPRDRVDLESAAVTVLEPPTLGKGRGGCGPIPEDVDGLASGTAVNWRATTRPPMPGKNGLCPATDPGPTRCTWTRQTWSG